MGRALRARPIRSVSKLRTSASSRSFPRQAQQHHPMLRSARNCGLPPAHRKRADCARNLPPIRRRRVAFCPGQAGRRRPTQSLFSISGRAPSAVRGAYRGLPEGRCPRLPSRGRRRWPPDQTHGRSRRPITVTAIPTKVTRAETASRVNMASISIPIGASVQLLRRSVHFLRSLNTSRAKMSPACLSRTDRARSWTTNLVERRARMTFEGLATNFTNGHRC